MFPSKLNSPRLSKPLAGPSGQVRLERPFSSYSGPLADQVQVFSGYRMDSLPELDCSELPALPRPTGLRIVRVLAPDTALPRLFNPPMVETVVLADLLRDATPFERFAIEPLTDLALFQSAVLLPGVADLNPAVSVTVMSGHMIHELCETGYLRNSSAQGQAIACALFAVTRADGKLRLIWDGRPFNQRCRPPPKIRFSRLDDDVSVLVRPPARSLAAVELIAELVRPTEALAGHC